MNSFSMYRTLESRLIMSRYLYKKIAAANACLAIIGVICLGQSIYKTWNDTFSLPDDVSWIVVAACALWATIALSDARMKLINNHSQKLLICDWPYAKTMLQKAANLYGEYIP